ncbi:hypothetical protein ABLG96_08255 [Nakamurella sp. A5-74]|uniref:YfhO family protein n=1 Tax=Nakamurella sp. A5-74 TaxID=3158264 RepID=A0AAU8DVP0_9ACTN
MAESAVAPAPERSPAIGTTLRARGRRAATDVRLYLLAVVVSGAGVAVMMRLWRVDWRVPFVYQGDALGSAAHFVTTLETGWYESQPRLGFPYGQHYHDFPFSDDLHLVFAKVLGWVTGGHWVAAFNGYYLLTFPLAAAGAVWFLRQCRLTGPTTVVLAVLYSVAPYHLQRNEAHLFLSGYYLIPVAMVLVLRVVRGQPLWGTRPRPRPDTGAVARVRSVLTGRGAGTVVILGLLVTSGVYYAVFVLLLLAVAALVAVAGHRSWSRFRGAVMAGIVGVGWFGMALLPDLLHAWKYGSDGDAFSRGGDGPQFLGLRIFGMLMPSPDHPIPELAALRKWFVARYPPDAEWPALGLVGTIGFLLLLGVGLGRMMRTSAGPVRPGSRLEAFGALAGLSLIATLVATTGGLGLVVSMITPAMRAWNRMVIVIALLALAGFGLTLEAVAVRLRRRWAEPGRRHAPGRPPMPVQRIVLVLSVLTLLVGGADQSLPSAVQQPSTVASFESDESFFVEVEASLPAGAAVFQLPFRAYPEGELIDGTTESDQLRGLLHTRSLRFSAGGIKGRPQTDWPAEVVALPTADFLTDIAIVGYSGIVIDRLAVPDRGASLLRRLEPTLRQPTVTSVDGRFAYLSLDTVLAGVESSMTPQQRARHTAEITHGATS